jgi:hypothetical protein
MKTGKTNDIPGQYFGISKQLKIIPQGKFLLIHKLHTVIKDLKILLSFVLITYL